MALSKCNKLIISLAIITISCGSLTVKKQQSQKSNGIHLIVLGTVQDAGSPHIACKKPCCQNLFEHPDYTRQVICLGLIDYNENKSYLFEASPDIIKQCKTLKRLNNKSDKELPDGIFVSHAHIGHYTGLMYLGKEATNAKKVPVYVMPRMKTYLETNGPWSQLVNDSNILLQDLHKNMALHLNKIIVVYPIQVPHRDEYSETIGFLINGPNKSALFIPDIDKWEKWDQDINKAIEEVDYAFVDGTFYSGEELNNRDISQIPHPFIIESMKKFEGLEKEEKNKIHFIHFNHTNPVLDSSSSAYQTVIKNGFHIARYLDDFEL